MNFSADFDDLPDKDLEKIFDAVDAELYGDDPEVKSLFDMIINDEDRYQDFEFLAKGGMKCIQKVFDTKLGRNVAMATLPAGAEYKEYDPFVREAKIAALMDHPNVISIFDVGFDPQKRPYFTMELRSGEEFDQQITRLHSESKPLSSRELYSLLEIFLKICDGISYAHSKGILHLDLKPSNVLVGDYGNVVVCDWGLGALTPNSGGEQKGASRMDRAQVDLDLLQTLNIGDSI
ncbi:MAG: protein kinase, partial [Planctomycetes bacterium]|nr:protein kinase [Planctomycetota bacterium]